MARRKNLSDRQVRHDAFHQRAKKLGFKSRAIFKLEEIDKRFHLFAPGMRVLDLGCAPGSWLQYARIAVGETGELVGIDRFEIEDAAGRSRLYVGDVFDTSAEELLGDLAAFDVVLSDMAPDTTGIRHVDQARCEVLFERAIEIAEGTLDVGGHFVGKLFQGPDFPNLIKRCRRNFDSVKMAKPASSRTRSIEQYVVARGFRGRPPHVDNTDDTDRDTIQKQAP